MKVEDPFALEAVSGLALLWAMLRRWFGGRS